MNKNNNQPKGCLRQKTILKTCTIILLWCISGMPGSYAQQQWSILYGPLRGSVSNNYPRETYDVAYTSTGSVIAAGVQPGANGGVASDICVAKFSGTNGAMQNEYFSDFHGLGLADRAVRVIVKEPYVYVLVSAQFTTAPQDGDIGIIKLDTSMNYVNGTYFNSPAGYDETPVDMGMDQYGNLYVLAKTVRPASGSDILLLKYDSNLGLLWNKYNTSTGSTDDSPAALAVEPSGICNITGYKITDATHGKRMAVLKYWGNGVLLWQKYYDVNSAAAYDDAGTGISYDPSTGDVYVTGYGQMNSGDNDWVAAKFDGVTGTRTWNKRYTSTATGDQGRGISFFNSGALYTCGNLTSTVGSQTSPNIFLKKLNPSTGATIWSRTYDRYDGTLTGITADDYANHMVVTPNEHIYVLGTASYSYSYRVTLNYDAAGTLTWSNVVSPGPSAVQAVAAIRGIYHPAQQALYEVGNYIYSIGADREWTVTKFAPTSIVNSETREAAAGNESSIDFALTAFPNPAKEKFTVQSDVVSPVEIRVFNPGGQLVFENSSAILPLEIDASKWAAGMYNLILKSGSTIASEKIIKQ